MPVSANVRISSKVLPAVFLFLTLQLGSASAFAAGEHGTLIRVANIYLSPDKNSTKLAEIERGRELVVLENTNPPWAHVEAFLSEEKTVSGWILDKGFVRSTNPDGDKIVFGEAADSEDEASRRQGRRGADKDALRLYYRVYDLFPNSTARRASVVPGRRYPLAGGTHRRNVEAVGKGARSGTARGHE